MTILAWLLGSKAGRITALCLLTAASIALVLLQAFRKGAASEQAKQTQASLAALRNRIRTDDEITKLTPAARRAALSEWVRGGNDTDNM